MESNEQSTPHSQLDSDQVSDIAAVFTALIEPIGLTHLASRIILDTKTNFNAVIQLPHHPDIIFSIYPSITGTYGDLRLRIRLFPGSITDTLAQRNNLIPHPTGATAVNNIASKSTLIALDSTTLTPTLRRALVKTKSTLLDEHPLEAPPTSHEGRKSYSLDDFEVIYVGEHSLWGAEALSEDDPTNNQNSTPNESRDN